MATCSQAEVAQIAQIDLKTIVGFKYLAFDLL